MATQDSRIKVKRSKNAGEIPKVAPSADHTDGTWSVINVYAGELFFNQTDGKLWIGGDGVDPYPIPLGKPNTVSSAVMTVKLFLTTSELLTLNATPIAFGLSIPTGYYAKPLACDFKGTFGSAAFATNTNISIRTVGGSNARAKGTGFLAFVSSTTTAMAMQAGGPNSIDYIDSADIEAYVETGDPTVGTGSSVELTLTYTILPI